MNVTDLGFKPEELRELVLDRAAQKLADEAAREEDISDRVDEMLRQRVEAVFASGLTGRIDELLNSTLAAQLDRAVQPVDIFGDKVGEPTTIRETLTERAKNFWSQLVEADGKVPKEVSHYTRDRLKTRAEWMLGKVVADEFAAQVKQNAVNILAVFKEKLREDGHAALDKHLDELVRVKSR